MQNSEWYLADLKSTGKNTIETVEKSLTDMFIRLVRIYPCLIFMIYILIKQVISVNKLIEKIRLIWGKCKQHLTPSSLNLPLSSSSTTSRELLPQFSTDSE